MTIAGHSIDASAISKPAAGATVYKVAAIMQARASDELRGELARVTLALDAGTQRYTVQVDGARSSIASMRATQVRVGDQIFLVGKSHPRDGVIRHDDIRKSS